MIPLLLTHVVLTSVVDAVATAAVTVITAKAGQIFIVALDSNATTGFSWVVVPDDAAAPFKSVGSTYLRPQKTMPGAGGTQLLIFRATRAGRGTLHLRYARPFEPHSVNAREVTFHVTITS